MSVWATNPPADHEKYSAPATDYGGHHVYQQQGQQQYQQQAFLTGGADNNAVGYPQGGGHGSGNNYAAVSTQEGNQMMQGTVQSSPFQLIYFTAACCVMVCAFFSGAALFFTGSLVDFLNLTYIQIFCLILAVLDTPVLPTLQGVRKAQWTVAKYANFLTRVTGKGIILVYLGSTCFAAVYANLEGIFTTGCAVLLNLYAMLVGLIGMVIGITKSMKLKRSREYMEQMHQQGLLEQKFAAFAVMYPVRELGRDSGLTKKEFNSLLGEVSGGHITWEDPDLELIYNALNRKHFFNVGGTQDTRQSEQKLTLLDLKEWINMSYVML